MKHQQVLGVLGLFLMVNVAMQFNFLGFAGVDSKAHLPSSVDNKHPFVDDARTVPGVGAAHANVPTARSEHAQVVDKLKPRGQSGGNGNDDGFAFVVSVQVSAQEKYLTVLQAQLDTWAKDIPAGRMFVVGPQSPPNPLWESSRCPDNDMLCKRLTSVENGYRAMQAGEHFDWLVTLNEDHYFSPANMARALKGVDASQSVILSGLGCGRLWKYAHPGKPKDPQATEGRGGGGGGWGGGGML